uniref:Ig-like domain-containing protein n=1 Tax=Astyanax mexicanus TaxID=7994 RepID=A0A3B1IMB9_ASTMX
TARAHSNSLIHCWYFFCYLTVFILLKIILLILAAPKFTRQPSDVAADIGSNVTLTCHAQGHPEPRITWRREDNTAFSSRMSILEDGTLLILASVSPLDNGEYTCTAVNDYTCSSTSFSSVPPDVRDKGLPANVSVVMNQPTSFLQCVATGVPAPSITWLKDGRPVDTTQGNGVRISAL